jgi:hypothetical protein
MPTIGAPVSTSSIGAALAPWSLEDKGSKEDVSFINPIKLIEDEKALGRKAAVEEVLQDRLAAHYAPNVSDYAGFNFRVKRQRGRMIVFSFQAESEKRERPWYLLWLLEKSNTIPWDDYKWDYACKEAPETSELNSKP